MFSWADAKLNRIRQLIKTELAATDPAATKHEFSIPNSHRQMEWSTVVRGKANKEERQKDNWSSTQTLFRPVLQADIEWEQDESLERSKVSCSNDYHSYGKQHKNTNMMKEARMIEQY